jgi:hypothetical protein
LIPDIAALAALSNHDDGRFIDNRGAGERTGVPSDPNAFDKRGMNSLLDGNLIEKCGEPLPTFVFDSHLVSLGNSSTNRIRIPD